MSEEEIRLECLRLATAAFSDLGSDEVLNAAKRMEEFVRDLLGPASS